MFKQKDFKEYYLGVLCDVRSRSKSPSWPRTMTDQTIKQTKPKMQDGWVISQVWSTISHTFCPVWWPCDVFHLLYWTENLLEFSYFSKSLSVLAHSAPLSVLTPQSAVMKETCSLDTWIVITGRHCKQARGKKQPPWQSVKNSAGKSIRFTSQVRVLWMALCLLMLPP